MIEIASFWQDMLNNFVVKVGGILRLHCSQLCLVYVIYGLTYHVCFQRYFGLHMLYYLYT